MNDGRSRAGHVWFSVMHYPLQMLYRAGIWLAVRAQDADAWNAYRALGLKNNPRSRPASDYQLRS
jgi:hypothetical protein